MVAASRLPETPFPLTPHEKAVLEQVLAFEAALPELMREHAGKWAVWLDGLRHVADTHAAARDWAHANLDRALPFAVTRVEVRRPVQLSRVAWPP